MKCALFYGPKDVRVEDVPIPKIKENEVLVKVKVAATCGTDVKTYKRGHPLFNPPVAFGHEFAGEIVEVGENVKDFSEKMRIVSHNSAPCGHCFYCKKGKYSLCENLTFLFGAFGEYIKIPENILKYSVFELPGHISYTDAVLLEPLSCVVYGIEKSNISLGDTVSIIGAGPIGLMFVLLAKNKGARVICSDVSKDKLLLAKNMGADVVVNVKEVKDQVEAVKAYTQKGRGADVTIEAVGLPEIWEKAIKMTRPGGIVTLFGGCKSGTSISIDTELLHYSELTIKGLFHTHPRYVKAAFDLICNGVIPTELFFSKSYNLEEINQALETHGNGESVKNLIYC